MRNRRVGLFAAAVTGLGGLTAIALAQSPPPASNPQPAVSPYQPGMMAPTTWRPADPPARPTGPGALPTAPATPRPTFLTPTDPRVVPAAPIKGSGPAPSSGIIQTGAVQLPPPVIPRPTEPTVPVPTPVVPSPSPSALPPGVAPGPRVTVEGGAELPGLPIPASPPAATLQAETGPKSFVPGPGSNPVPGTMPQPSASPVSVGPLPAKQAPAVTLETVAPDAVTVGADFSYELVVKNDGATAVWNVRVEDELPAGAKLVGSEPAAEMNGARMGWTLGTLEPASTRKIKVTLRPAEEGEVRTRATVSFATGTEAKVRVTRPKIAVELVAGETARAGEPATFQIKLTNSGSGPANNLVLQANLSEGLVHAGGAVLELKLPALPAGQSKTFPLKVTAAKAGPQTCGVVVAADGTNPESARHALNVVEPKLTVRNVGPAKCLVKGEPVYLIELTNPGTAGTDPVSVTAAVPAGFEFVQASDGGSMNPATREITWRLNGLEPGKGKAVSLKLKAAAPCDGALKTVARTVPPAEPVGEGIQPAAAIGRTLEVKAESALKAEGVPGLRFEVIDVDDPVEVGKEAVYEIKVVNTGTGPCTNVVVLTSPADGTVATAANGPTTARAQGTAVAFDPVAKLDVKGELVFRVRVKGTVAGDHKFKVQVSSDQVKSPITKEENTRFYKD